MGTNFYIGTKNKEAKDIWFGYEYELTDEPDWMYMQHIAKTSIGWLPLFEAHKYCKSVSDLRTMYHTGEFVLFDEYGTVYTWDEFDDRVLHFNGGRYGAVPREKVEQDKDSPFYDPAMPPDRPVSHLEYDSGRYKDDYYRDEDGYEWTTHEFS